MTKTVDGLRKVRRELDFGLLKDRRVRRISLAQFTSAAGDAMVLAALPATVRATGGGDAEFSAALGVQGLAMALLFIPSGVIGDRFRRRTVVVVADLLRFGARGAFAILLLLGDVAFWQLLVAQAANGAGTALFSTTMDGFIPEVLKGERTLQKVNALRFLALSVGTAFGPAVGGILYSTAGADVVFGVDAVTFLVSATLIVGLPTPFAAVRARSSRDGIGGAVKAVFSDAVEGWHVFRRIPWFWRVATEFAVLNTLVFAPYFVIAPHVAEVSLGGSTAWVLILIGSGLGEVVGSLFMMAWEPKRPLLIANLLVGVWVVPLVLLAFLAPVGLLMFAAVLAGISFAIFGAIWETVKQTHTPENVRARLASFDHLGSLGLVPFGYVLGGALLASVGAKVALIGGAVILLVATFAVAGHASVRNLRADAEGGDERDEIPQPQVTLVGAITE